MQVCVRPGARGRGSVGIRHIDIVDEAEEIDGLEEMLGQLEGAGRRNVVVAGEGRS